MTLFILGIPKTGNSTLLKTFQQVSSYPDLLSAHYITDEGIRDKLLTHETYDGMFSESLSTAFRAIIDVQSILKKRGFYPGYHMLRQPGEKLVVITSFRDPVDLVMSSVFYHFRECAAGEIVRQLDLAFTKHLDYWVGVQDEWIDKELGRLTGIDLFDHPFDHAQGYQLYEKDCVSVLAFRTDAISSKLTKAAQRNLGLSLPFVLNDNLGNEKSYALLYEEVRKNYRLADDVRRQLLSSRTASHFFGGEAPQSELRKGLSDE